MSGPNGKSLANLSGGRRKVTRIMQGPSTVGRSFVWVCTASVQARGASVLPVVLVFAYGTPAIRTLMYVIFVSERVGPTVVLCRGPVQPCMKYRAGGPSAPTLG